MLALFGVIFLPNQVFRQLNEATSTSFTIRYPVITILGSEQTAESGNFKLLESGRQTAVGESTASNFVLRSGFLYFPSVAAPSEETPPEEKITVPGAGIIQNLIKIIFPGKIIPPEKIPEVVFPCEPVTDLNCDGKVDLKDLSIFLFLSPKEPSDNPADFNADKKINTRDLSQLFSDWSVKLLAFDRENGYKSFSGKGLQTSEEYFRDIEERQFASPAASEKENEGKISSGIISKILNKIAKLIGRIIDWIAGIVNKF